MIESAVANITLPTGGSTVDFTIAGFGTPLWYEIAASSATALGTSTAHLSFGHGVGDGTRQWAVACQSEDASGVNDTSRYSSSSRSLSLLTPGTTNLDGELSFNSFITDGVRFNVDNAFNAAWLGTITLFKGTGVSVYAGSFVIDNSIDATVDVTAPNFQPTYAQFSTVGDSSAGANTTAMMSQGFAVSNGGIVQRAITWGQKNSGSTSVVAAQLHVTRMCSAVTVAVTSIDWAAELTAWLTTGFRIATRDSGAASPIVYYLAVRAPDNLASCFTVTQPTATGNNSKTLSGHKPQWLKLLHSRIGTASSFITDNDAAVLGVSSITSSAQGSVSGSSQDAVGTMVAKSRKNSIALDIPSHTGANENKATFVSFDATGWTLNYSAARGTANLLVGLSIQESPTGGVTGTLTKTLAALTLSGAGKVATKGTATKTLTVLTAASAGKLLTQGSAAPTLAALVGTSIGALLTVGTAAVSLGELTLSASGTGGELIAGSLDAPLAELTGSATGELDVRGSSTRTLGALTSTATAILVIEATQDSTLDEMAVSSTGSITLTGGQDSTLDDLTGTGEGILDLIGGVTATLEAATLASLGAGESREGTLDATLAPLVLVAKETTSTGDLLISLLDITHIHSCLR